MTMRDDPHPVSSRTRDWRELYTAALFEKDREKVPSRIAEAEEKLILRARELFSLPEDNIEERDAIDAALYALRALRSCLNLKTNESDVD